jgi:hypothetical protein
MKIFTVAKEDAPELNRKARRRLAKQIRKNLSQEKS